VSTNDPVAASRSTADESREERLLLALDKEVRDDRELAGQICHACVASMDIDGAAISLLTSTSARITLVATDPVAELLEDLQFTLGEGACMEAAATAQPVLVADMSDPSQAARWPVYAAAVVAQAHVRAVFALPLQWGATNLGVLDLYRRSPGPLNCAELRNAVRAADTAAAMLLLGQHTDPADEHAWDRSWGNRVEIHQAVAMVGTQMHLGPDDALAWLRARSFAENRLLPDIAAEIVTRRPRFVPDG
jgi:transcriptional regulator with GAF, ATPase, and Fis domain